MYDELAAHYHLIFEDWEASIARQAGILGRLIESLTGRPPVRILDAACGIGTQAIGLARRGHHVTGSDRSAAAIERARQEAAARHLDIQFCTADVRDLPPLPGEPFDVLLMADNALAHLLSDAELRRAAAGAARKIKPGGLLLATIRDYDRLVIERPAFHGPAFYSDSGRRRIVHQVWDWTGERHYHMHLYITRESGSGWETLHFTSQLHAVSATAVSAALERAGFIGLRWLPPEETGYYQPLVVARTPL